MNPPMNIKDKTLLLSFPVNGSYYLGIYEGKLSEYDILIKYRQFDNNKWSHIRTPKHIHWAVDILIKHYCNAESTDMLLDFLINLWEETKPIMSKEDKNRLLDSKTLLDEINSEAPKYSALADKGEYSVKFLILIAKLLMVQEKTNKTDAYMFKRLLDQLKDHKDIFKIVSTATLR